MRNTIEQLKLVGPRSLGVALLTAGFVGMVFTIQVRHHAPCPPAAHLAHMQNTHPAPCTLLLWGSPALLGTPLVGALLHQVACSKAVPIVPSCHTFGSKTPHIISECVQALPMLQFVREFAKLGLTRSVGGVLGLALSRELTPVVTSIILAGALPFAYLLVLSACTAAHLRDPSRLAFSPPKCSALLSAMLAGHPTAPTLCTCCAPSLACRTRGTLIWSPSEGP